MTLMRRGRRAQLCSLWQERDTQRQRRRGQRGGCTHGLKDSARLVAVVADADASEEGAPRKLLKHGTSFGERLRSGELRCKPQAVRRSDDGGGCHEAGRGRKPADR